MLKKRIGVIFGGKSTEHEVSVMSAESVIKAIDREKYEVTEIFIDKEGNWSIGSPWKLPEVCDFALPILHGINGEDGTVQGIFELLNMPYGGCGVLGCATAMDKLVAKEIFEAAGLPQTPYISFVSSDISSPEGLAAICKKAGEKLKYPLFVKPVNMGSSVGITKVTEPEKLAEAIELAARYDSRFAIEQGVDCIELELGVMGNEETIVAGPGEILTGDEFYTYDDKYINGVSSTRIPADIPEEKRIQLREMAQRAYKALGCCGFARCDFMMDKNTKELYINEINAIPGFTKISMFPKLFIAEGMTYTEIITRIIEYGYERYNAKNNR